MLFLAILVLALGWAGWLWAWGRDRVASNYGLSSRAIGSVSHSRWATPRSASDARTRRRDVVVGLLVGALVSFVLAKSWSALWVLHGAFDIGLVSYGFAVLRLEQRLPSPIGAPASPLLTAPRMTLQPLLDDGL